jgi:hypothetical protein
VRTLAGHFLSVSDTTMSRYFMPKSVFVGEFFRNRLYLFAEAILHVLVDRQFVEGESEESRNGFEACQEEDEGLGGDVFQSDFLLAAILGHFGFRNAGETLH